MKTDYYFPAGCCACCSPNAQEFYRWTYSTYKESTADGKVIQHSLYFDFPLCTRCYYLRIFPFPLLGGCAALAYYIAAFWLFFFSGTVPGDMHSFIKITGILFGLVIPGVILLLLLCIMKLTVRLTIVRLKKTGDGFYPNFVNKKYRSKFEAMN